MNIIFYQNRFMQSIFVRFSLVFITMLFAEHVYAAKESFVNSLRGTTVQAGASLIVQDDKYMTMLQNATGNGAWYTRFSNSQIDNYLELSLDPYSTILSGSDYEITAEIQVSYDIWDLASQQFKTVLLPAPVLLTIHYKADANVVQTNKSIYKFSGGNRLKATILSVTATPNVPVSLILDAGVTVERYYPMNVQQSPMALGHKTASISSRGELEIVWNYLSGAEEYELEWTHVDNYSVVHPAWGANTASQRPASDIPISVVDFQTNCTRVTTTNTFYRIPLMYERGYILYRVRGVGRNKDADYKKNAYTVWSGNENFTTVATFSHKYMITEGTQFVKNLNWQSSVSFAEEGKNKSSVSFFDGSLRNRQTVTKMNTQDEVIAGETIYDEQGRPVVQVLPAPVNSAHTGFKPGLTLNTSGQPYSPEDLNKNELTGCYGAAAAMHTGSGASNYYSPQNPDKTNENKYIPDAEGYPYTQTTYMPDNTGRISAQSGVGAEHRIGSGHETRYIYSGPPSEQDVNKLFGTEVGKVVHYKKNLVIDANGQVSVSYLDAQGRVIATALAGAAPDQLDKLPDSTTQQKTLDVLATRTSETELRTDATKIFSRTLGVSTRSKWNFDYDIQAKKFIEVCDDFSLGETIHKCYDCILDLQILLTDACGQNYLVSLPGFDAQNNTAQVGESILEQIRAKNYVAICTPPSMGPSLSFAQIETPLLEAGSYTISRVLSVNEEALAAYLEDYLSSSSCLLNLNDFVLEETALNVSGRCDNACTECLEQLGSYDQYDGTIHENCEPCLTRNEYEERLRACQEICDPGAADCENLETTMLDDLTIFGQYSGVMMDIPDDPSTPLVDESRKYMVYNPGENKYFPLSILNEENVLPQKKWFRGAGPMGRDLAPNWRHPYLKRADGSVVHYYTDENGNRDYVTLNKIGNSYLPEVLNISKVYTDMTGNTVRYYTDPENLKNSFFFLANWKNSWAKSLLVYHPEHCYLEFCRKNSVSYDFDNRWFSIERQEDLPEKFYDPLGILHPGILTATSWPAYQHNPSLSIDPYFNPAFNSDFQLSDYTMLKKRLIRYLPKRTGVGASSPDSDYYNLWQVAYLMTKCPTYEEVPGTFSSCDQSGCGTILLNPFLLMELIRTEEDVREAYIGMYYSIKREIIEKRATQYAIKNGCFNGCIGKQDFDPHQDGFYAATYRETKVETYRIPNDFGIWKQMEGKYEPNSPMDFYLQMLALIHFGGTREVSKTIVHFPSQHMNPEQPCNNHNYPLYADRHKSYNRVKDGVPEYAIGEASCMVEPMTEVSYETDPTELYTQVGPVCAEDNDLMAQFASEKAAFGLYEECGECPDTKMLEGFLDEVASFAAQGGVGLASANMQLNCFPDGLRFFIQPLEERFGFSRGLGNEVQLGPIVWSADPVSLPTNKLEVKIQKTVGGTPEVTKIVLAKKNSYNFTDPNTGLVHTFSFGWNELKGLCCMRASDQNLILAPNDGAPNYRFKARATVEISFDGGATIRTHKIDIEGYTEKIRLTCEPPVLCEKSMMATELQNLWNTLLYSTPQVQGTDEHGNLNGDIIPAVPGKFTSEGFMLDRDLSVLDRNNLPYEYALSVPLLGYLSPLLSATSKSAYWNMVQPEVSSPKKTFLLKILNDHQAVVGQFPFEFEIDPIDFSNGVSFARIKKFSSMVPDKSAPDPTRYFLIKALVSTASGELKYVMLKGYSPVIMTGQCKRAVHPANRTLVQGQ
jgi:hypothetical protein